MTESQLRVCTDATLKETIAYLRKNVQSFRAICRLAGLHPSVFVTYTHQVEKGERITMSDKVRKKLYNLALELKAEEAEAIKKLQEKLDEEP